MLKNANLQGAKLRLVDLSAIQDLSGVFWHNAILDRTRMNWEQLGLIGEEMAEDYEKAKEAYLLLKDNFNDLGHYDYARQAYIEEREMERKAHWPPWRAKTYHNDEFAKIQGNPLVRLLKRLRFYLKYITRRDVWTWSVLTFFKWTSLYGQSPLRVFGSAIVLILGFSLAYPFIGIVSSGRAAIPWWPQSLIYSLASFATLELSGYQATTLGAQLLTSLEALVGIIWLAYFVYAFTNMMRSS